MKKRDSNSFGDCTKIRVLFWFKVWGAFFARSVDCAIEKKNQSQVRHCFFEGKDCICDPFVIDKNYSSEQSDVGECDSFDKGM